MKKPSRRTLAEEWLPEVVFACMPILLLCYGLSICILTSTFTAITGFYFAIVFYILMILKEKEAVFQEERGEYLFDSGWRAGMAAGKILVDKPRTTSNI